MESRRVGKSYSSLGLVIGEVSTILLRGFVLMIFCDFPLPNEQHIKLIKTVDCCRGAPNVPASPLGDNPHGGPLSLYPALLTPQVTWRFFQEELPTTFFIRRLTRCRITRLASQCAKLVGESMPDGVDYQLQPELTEHILQVISHEFYQRPPQEFYQWPEDGFLERFF